MMKVLYASIVLFHNDMADVKKTINDVMNSNICIKLYLIDNSPNDELKILADMDEKIVYIFNDRNLGYGKAHNIAIQKSIEDAVPFHIVLNPDVSFEPCVLVELFEYMQEHSDVGNIMPQVLYPDGEVQYLCKLLPTPVDLIFRRFTPFDKWKKHRNMKYELRFSGYSQLMNVPSLSGCFMFLRVDALKKVGLFDENFFMYLEDVDLNRRLHQKYKTVFYPSVSIIHDYAKESYKSKKLLWYHIKSAFYYFNKWGWIYDSERKHVNIKCLKAMK